MSDLNTIEGFCGGVEGIVPGSTKLVSHTKKEIITGLTFEKFKGIDPEELQDFDTILSEFDETLSISILSLKSREIIISIMHTCVSTILLGLHQKNNTIAINRGFKAYQQLFSVYNNLKIILRNHPMIATLDERLQKGIITPTDNAGTPNNNISTLSGIVASFITKQISQSSN